MTGTKASEEVWSIIDGTNVQYTCMHMVVEEENRVLSRARARDVTPKLLMPRRYSPLPFKSGVQVCCPRPSAGWMWWSAGWAPHRLQNVCNGQEGAGNSVWWCWYDSESPPQCLRRGRGRFGVICFCCVTEIFCDRPSLSLELLVVFPKLKWRWGVAPLVVESLWCVVS